MSRHYAYQRRPRNGSAAALANGLGWFSIGLGAAELLAPRALGRALGMEDQAGLLRAYGVREVAVGIGILAQDDPTPWMWARVAGDALDLATLAPGLHPANRARGRVAFAMGTVAAVTVLDALCADALSSERRLPYTRTTTRPDDDLLDDLDDDSTSRYETAPL